MSFTKRYIEDNPWLMDNDYPDEYDYYRIPKESASQDKRQGDLWWLDRFEEWK